MMESDDGEDIQPLRFHLSTAMTTMLMLSLLLCLNLRVGPGWPMQVLRSETLIWKGGAWVYERRDLVDLSSASVDFTVAMLLLSTVYRICERLARRTSAVEQGRWRE